MRRALARRFCVWRRVWVGGADQGVKAVMNNVQALWCAAVGWSPRQHQYSPKPGSPRRYHRAGAIAVECRCLHCPKGARAPPPTPAPPQGWQIPAPAALANWRARPARKAPTVACRVDLIQAIGETSVPPPAGGRDRGRFPRPERRFPTHFARHADPRYGERAARHTGPPRPANSHRTAPIVARHGANSAAIPAPRQTCPSHSRFLSPDHSQSRVV